MIRQYPVLPVDSYWNYQRFLVIEEHVLEHKILSEVNSKLCVQMKLDYLELSFLYFDDSLYPFIYSAVINSL